MNNSVIILAGIGIIQSLIFGLLIIFKNIKKASDWVLLIWFLTFASHLALILLIPSSGLQLVVILAKTIALLHGPLLLLYTFSVFNRHFSKNWLIHVLTFIILASSSFLINDPNYLDQWEVILLVAKTTSLIGYPVYIMLWLKARIRFLKTTRADSFIVDSQWVKTLAILILIYAALGIFHVLSNILLYVEFSIILDILLYVAMVTIIGFYGLKFGMVYTPTPPTIPSGSKERYKNSPLKRDEILVMREKIDSFFAETEDYRNPEFSLAFLSEKLDLKKHHLSEVINLDMGTTFYDIVNAKRIQYAMQRIKDHSETHITLEGLGYECGFNTKSAFYHHFKSFTGKTPGQFKSEIRPD